MADADNPAASLPIETLLPILYLKGISTGDFSEALAARFRAAHVGRQDRRREPDAVGVGSVRLAIAYTRLADGDRTDTSHHLAFRQVTVAHDALVAVRGLQIGMLAEKVRNLGLDRLGQQSTRPIAQDFGELIVDVSWLNQLDDVIFGHGISLLRWRSGGVKHPHDMPPFRFPPSPTFGDSSLLVLAIFAGDLSPADVIRPAGFQRCSCHAWGRL
ncbi:hypothetical protein GCM10007857_44580 [Bradyrhizobium iriomotense]|uniref:Mutator family transposase n=1 Tax=Bradyrhizobium iriomotense TaxID=441950 RepID=A0ABQ6B024_9BRAD|nr:hypothetical protein [Bradyrhizobium iriomotense]GLR87747.1 hypothetical protein GCM10007857_44580 [Bradyrhizobium iriomotense]